MSTPGSARRCIQLSDLRATTALAAGLARVLPAELNGWMILLGGELGAGKSTFARALLQAMGHEGAVPSPTYTLVEPYRIRDNNIYHIDLYRISGIEELEFLGWSDLQDGLLLIEWPERVPHLADDADIIIRMQYDGDARLAGVDLRSDRATKLPWPGKLRHAQG